MWTRLPLVLGLSALGVALAAMPADAGSSRVTTFSVVCDGTNKHVDFNAAGFTASSTQFPLGGEVTLIGGSLAYIVVRAQGDERKQILTIGTGVTHAGFAMPTFYQTTANASGEVLITIDAGCGPGSGPVQAVVTVYFN